MLGFYIFKPDMVLSKESIDYYISEMKKNNNVDILEFYNIEDWTKLSKILYEPDDRSISLKELKELRKRMLTTIKGYQEFYSNTNAILNIIEIKDCNRLQELYDFKKELRKKFVYNERKVYLKFNNLTDEILENKLENCNIEEINCEYETCDLNQTPSNQEFNLIFFNKIHFPDPKITLIKRDLKLIKEAGIIKPKNLIKNFI